MTDKEKLEKIKALADKMYSRMAYLTSNTRPIRQAMDEYHQFIINEYHKEEPVSNGLDLGCGVIWRNKEPISEDLEQEINEFVSILTERRGDFPKLTKLGFRTIARHFSNWQKQKDESYTKSMYKVGVNTGKELIKQQMIAKAVDATVHIDAGGYPYIPQMELYDYDKDIPLAKEGDKVKIIVVKEDCI